MYKIKKLTLTDILLEKVDRLKILNSPLDSLYFMGADINKFSELPTVAIIGTRKPTPYGLEQTKQLANALARSGVVVVSGLALGVDAIAHTAALEAGGKCIAVLPSDLTHIYPATNRILAEKILESEGALLSEYKENPRPKKVDFLIRNRIVAALSDAVIVTEAAAQSGTLNTARHAKQMNIPVFALPGNVTSPMSKGCNWLIQHGAKLLSSSEDILNQLDIMSTLQLSMDVSTSSPKETLVLQKIALGNTHIDLLLHETAMSLSELQEILTMLEVDSRVRQTVDGAWELT